MNKKLIYTTFLMILSFSVATFAASPGSLDFSFSDDGKILNNISVSATGIDVAVQSDGKILASGVVNTGVSGNALYVARFNLNNTIDTTFGTSGVAIVDFGLEIGAVMKIQSDGKILLRGSITGPTNADQDLVVARLNTNGTLDTTFDTDGKVTISHSSTAPERFGNIDVASDGKIVVIGELNFGDISVARLNTDGSLDTTFNGGGKISVDLGSTNQSCRGFIQSDGKILVTATVANVSSIGVGRLTAAGFLDTTFGTAGIVTVSFTAGFSRPTDILTQPNGRILVAGYAASSPNDSLIFRLTTAGVLDTTFDGDGKFEQKTNGISNNLILEPNSKITMGITGGILRVLSDGSLDTSFGFNGVFKGTAGNNAIAIQPDGKLLTAGSSGTSLLLTRHVTNVQPTASSDFDGDAVADTAVFRPSTGNWFILRSIDNSFVSFQFGLNGDVPIDGDFDGDGRNDLAIFRPSSGVWFFQRSSDNTTLGATFGTSTDKPIPGDYDKDGKTDIAVFRPSTGEWLILRSSTNFSTFFGYPFGQNGDIPIQKRGA
jgi:uncharacterized delta-60 repeat protein